METLTAKNNIQSRIIATKLIFWRDLKFIQNDNFKELSKEAKHKLKSSIVGNNFTQPFYVWEGEDSIYCLDGKHRFLLLQELINEGVSVPFELPATFIDCKNKKEAARLVLLFSSQYAKITNEGLNDFLTLNDLDFSELKEQIDIPEFSELRFEQKFGNIDSNYFEDEVSVTDEENVIVSKGDIFHLNDHRLYCGSFQDSENLKTLTGGKLARIVFTDPPYNLPANSFTNKGEAVHKDFAMGGGEMSDDEFVDFITEIMRTCCINSIKGSIHYICMDWRHIWHMSEASKKVYGSVIPKQLIVWNKSNPANGSFYRAKHELIFIYKNGEEKHLSHLELEDRVRANVWDYPTASSFSNPDRGELKNHPTPKPVQMVVDVILDTTNKGDIVIDFFMGSGTTLIAAELTNRVAFGTEIEPKYIQCEIVRYIKQCQKLGVDVNFKHANGELTLEDFLKLIN